MIVPVPRLEAARLFFRTGAARGTAHDINFVASWLPGDPEPERHMAWALSAWESMQTFSHAVYANVLADDPLDHVKVAYRDHAYERLTAVMRKYDPKNFFRFNPHIPPQQMTGGECPE